MYPLLSGMDDNSHDTFLDLSDELADASADEVQ